MALLYGDPAKDGIFVMRLKFPANYKIPAHTHPTDEVVTVVSGEFNIGMGATFDPAKTKALTAGGVIAMPPGTQHYVQIDKETVVQLSTRGPWAISYVNPADDPRKSQ
jgi:quercetin dioxygenase-like cupin family protein